MSHIDVLTELERRGNSAMAEHAQRFFKTGPGEYGAGDKFLGIRVPELRKVARANRDLPQRDVLSLLKSPWHEARLVALLIWVDQYTQGDEVRRQMIFDAYLKNTRRVNNWDLVDSSAHLIVGPHLMERERKLLDQLAKSELLWERRIAILATLHFIRHDQFTDTLRIARSLFRDEADLIHKAVGWMLREVGKRDAAAAEKFLLRHYQKMPRTMLRYAIERYPAGRRAAYLQGTI